MAKLAAGLTFHALRIARLENGTMAKPRRDRVPSGRRIARLENGTMAKPTWNIPYGFNGIARLENGTMAKLQTLS